MGVCSFAGLMSKDWLLVGKFQHFGHLNVGFVPFEDKELNSFFFKSKSFFHFADVYAPERS